MLRYFLLLPAFLFLCISSYAQISSRSELDSLLGVLPSTAQDTNRVNMLISISYLHIYDDNAEGVRYGKEALTLAEKLKYKNGGARANTAIGRNYWHMGKFSQAIEHHEAAKRQYQEIDDPESVAVMDRYIGQDYADSGIYAEALKYFDLSLNYHSASGDLHNQAYDLGLKEWVYTKLGLYAEASQIAYQGLWLWEEAGDSFGLAVTQGNIAAYLELQGNYKEANELRKKVIESLLKFGDFVNATGVTLDMGTTYLLMHEDSLALSCFRMALDTARKYGDNVKFGSANQEIQEYYMSKGQYQKALHYGMVADTAYGRVNSSILQATLYSEIGYCLVQLGRFEEAQKYFDKAWLIGNINVSTAERFHYFHRLVSLDSARGNWKDAFEHFKLAIYSRDSMFNEENTKKQVQSQMQYDFDKQEAAAKAEQEKKDIEQRTIRNSIAAALGGALIFLVVVYRQRNRISKEKKRSEELLLNILPEETAEELKATGGAQAKQYDLVSVMFTDFKNFTQVSERLTAAELVQEIHLCYSAFDKIITKYHLEKIKTIGDSYMCAGGLPVPNQTHAEDTVKAAIEIRDFVRAEKERRKAEGQPFFDIRIGVHTGPVVAGIVGIKKFAYDIWGDTVNTASRMESSGEPGKVNVSGTTYELIKDKFTCSHRGKIAAKNKGEIDMYFVENKHQ